MRTRLAPAAWYLLVGLVTVALLVPVMQLWDAHLSVPFWYYTDALSGSVHVKTLLDHGWIDHNPSVGAPWGRDGNDYPTPDNLHLLVMAAMSPVISRFGVLLNAYYLLCFPLIAVAAAWFFRTLGTSRTVAMVMAQLFAFAPYHAYRGEIHLFLAGYYAVPLAGVVIYRTLSGDPLWGRNPARPRPLRWVTGRSLATVGCLAVLGTSSSYYAVFTLMLLTFAGAVALLQERRWRRLLGVVSAQLLLIAVLVVNMLPNLLYEHAHGQNLLVPARGPRGTEVYSFKLSSLLLPPDSHRIDALAHYRRDYDLVFPFPSEMPSLGVVASAGLLVLLAVVLVSACASRLRDDQGWVRERRLGALALFTFLIGTVGGISTLFTLVVSDMLRGWNRISIFLALFCLAAVALLVERGLARLSARPLRVRRTATAAVALLLLGVGVYDQTPAVDKAQRASVLAIWRSDTAFTAGLERQLPKGAMLFQLPYMYYPESPPLERIGDSDEFRLYLQSTDLRWSYGGIRGRPTSDWPVAVSRAPTKQLTGLVAAAGFSGIVVDRLGYKDGGRQLQEELTALLGAPPTVSPDGRFRFFDLRGYAAAQRSRLGAATVEALGRRVVLHPVGYEQDSMTDRPSLVLENPLPTATSVDVSFAVDSASRPSRLRVRWPDGSTEERTGGRALAFHRRLLLPPGRTEVQVSVPADASVAGEGPLWIRLLDVRIDDPVLTSFVP